MLQYVKLIRPPLFLMGFIASWALLVKFGLWGSFEGFLILVAVGVGNAAFTVYNEIFDIEQDKINKPWKPLPSGQVSLDGAKKIASAFLLFSLSGLVLLWQYNPWYLCYGILGYFFSLVYDVFKVRGAFGNFCLGSAYVMAAYMSTGLTDLKFSIFFGILTVAHNIMVQLQDLEADRRARVVTFPQLMEREWTCATVMILSTISFFGFVYSGYTLFAVASVLVFIAAYIDRHIELLIRYGVRLLLLVAFVLMGLKVI